MIWFKINKCFSNAANHYRHYRKWKSDLATESKNQCVYCCIHTNSFGGIRNFHVEHYRPKSNPKFSHLEHTYTNLFYACSICNSFKGKDWSGEPSIKFDNNSYPDPSKVDYSNFLKVASNHQVVSSYKTGKYIINRLYLNRPQLILERRTHSINVARYKELNNLILLCEELKRHNSDKLVPHFISMVKMLKTQIESSYISPYTEEEVRR